MLIDEIGRIIKIIPNIKINSILILGIPSEASQSAESVGHSNRKIPIGLLILVKFTKALSLSI